MEREEIAKVVHDVLAGVVQPIANDQEKAHVLYESLCTYVDTAEDAEIPTIAALLGVLIGAVGMLRKVIQGADGTADLAKLIGVSEDEIVEAVPDAIKLMLDRFNGAVIRAEAEVEAA